MLSKPKKSILWCGEKVDIFNTEELTEDEKKIDTDNKTKLLFKAAEDLKFLCEMSQEDLDKDFDDVPETFAKANLMVNKKPVDTKPYCGDLDQLVSNGKFLTDDAQARYDRDKTSKNKKYVPICERRRFKRTCIKRYEPNIRNGFYTGFMTSYLCWNCEKILSCHPSPHKRINWIPRSMCFYCNETTKTTTAEDLKWLRELTHEWKGIEKENSMYNLEVKVLTEVGRRRNAGFEHCWTTSMDLKMDQD